MNTSKTFCEAEADALRAAIEFRKGLERNGVVKTKRVENPHSGVKGVFWHILDKAWEVKMHINGQTLYGGKFTPKDSTPEEVELARLLAVESRRKLEFQWKKREGSERGRSRVMNHGPESKDFRGRPCESAGIVGHRVW